MRAALLVLLAGCTQLQSAHTLPPGASRFGAGISHNTVEKQDGANWMGELTLSHGVVKGFEVGGVVARTPGVADASSAIGVIPKVSLSETAGSAVAFEVPVGVSWQEVRDDWQHGAVEIAPTMLFGTDVGRRTELVAGPRIGVMWRPDDDNLFGIGGTAGLAIGDRMSALHLELGILLYESANQDLHSVFTLGLGVTAGN